MELIKPSDLSLDLSIYPRPGVDDALVYYLREVLRSDGSFDPLEIGNPGKLIIDGAHRRVAWIEEYEDKPIPCVVKSYRDKKAMLTRAMELNIRHGKRLAASDFRICFERGALLGMQEADIVATLGITREFTAALLGTNPVIGGAALATKKPQEGQFKPGHGQEKRFLTREQWLGIDEMQKDDLPLESLVEEIGDRWAGRICGDIARLKHKLEMNGDDDFPHALVTAMEDLCTMWKKKRKGVAA